MPRHEEEERGDAEHGGGGARPSFSLVTLPPYEAQAEAATIVEAPCRHPKHSPAFAEGARGESTSLIGVLGQNGIDG